MANMIGQLPVELERMLMEEFDMLGLLNWRPVCGRYLLQVDTQLRKEMEAIVKVYLPGQASILLDALPRFRAVITGEAAIAFVLRDMKLLGMDLEICVAEPEAEELHAFLQKNFTLTKVCGRDKGAQGYEGPLDRITTHYCIIAARRRRYLSVVSSYTPSPLTPLTAVNNTAFMTFFSPAIVGCAYPALTLRRCALTRSNSGYGPWWSIPCDRRRNLGLVLRGNFRLDDDPGILISPPLEPLPRALGVPDRRWCLGHMYLCACRDRYFGDHGSFVVVLDLHSSGLEYLLLVPESAKSMEVQGYGEELYSNTTVLVTWRFPGWPVRCIGAWDYSRELDGFDTGNAIHLSNVWYVNFNLAARFVGEHMLEGRRRIAQSDLLRHLDPLAHSLPMFTTGRDFRARAWAEHVSVDEGRYAMSQVKIEECAWEWFTNALIIKEKAATVVFVGCVRSVSYQADCWDDPVFKIDLDFVRTGDRGAFINLLNTMHEHPPVPAWFTAVKELKSTHMPTAPPVFDGTAGGDTLEAPLPLEFTGVAPWDLVMVETRVISTEFGATFNIERIMLLARAPEKPYKEPKKGKKGVGKSSKRRTVETYYYE
ncbi:hypothetical protein C8Q76DRAFT_801303 [Earliella scabrosa]|nr:hypothetical protein C8Q76DRAFT_801303 [Earliella scabrosa]